MLPANQTDFAGLQGFLSQPTKGPASHCLMEATRSAKPETRYIFPLLNSPQQLQPQPFQIL